MAGLFTSPTKENTGVDRRMAANNDSVQTISLYNHCVKTPTSHPTEKQKEKDTYVYTHL